MKNEEILEKIKKYNWYHEIEIQNGIKTSAVDALEVDGKYQTHSSSKSHWNQKNVFR